MNDTISSRSGVSWDSVQVTLRAIGSSQQAVYVVTAWAILRAFRGSWQFSGDNQKQAVFMRKQAPLNSLQQFIKQKTISLKTRKRDGTWVATPVNIAVEGDHAYIRTWRGSGKSIRLRNFPEAEIAP